MGKVPNYPYIKYGKVLKSTAAMLHNLYRENSRKEMKAKTVRAAEITRRKQRTWLGILFSVTGIILPDQSKLYPVKAQELASEKATWLFLESSKIAYQENCCKLQQNYSTEGSIIIYCVTQKFHCLIKVIYLLYFNNPEWMTINFIPLGYWFMHLFNFFCYIKQFARNTKATQKS